MSTKVIHPYIDSKPGIGEGKPIIAGTRTRLANIVAYHKLGLSPEELAREFPHLSLSQIHDALSYYYEHQEEIDKEIDDDSEENIKKLLLQICDQLPTGILLRRFMKLWFSINATEMKDRLEFLSTWK